MNYGNLAYELPQRQQEPLKKPKVNRNKSVMKDSEQMKNRSKYMRGICTIIAIAISAGFMISQFVTVNDTQNRIASLRKNLASMEAATSQMVFDMDQSVDLAEIERVAVTKLGMQRPEKYQTIYVNVKQNDMTEKTAGEVEGVGNSIMSGLKKFGGNIVNFFSIK